MRLSVLYRRHAVSLLKQFVEMPQIVKSDLQADVNNAFVRIQKQVMGIAHLLFVRSWNCIHVFKHVQQLLSLQVD